MPRPADFLVVLTAAALTVLIAAPLLHPAPGHAGDEATTKAGEPVQLEASPIGTPVENALPFVLDGLEVTLSLDRSTCRPGDTPVLALVALNRNGKKCKAKATVKMKSAAPMSPWSRSMPRPVTVFRKEIEVDVPPGEILVVLLRTDHALEENALVDLFLSSGEINHPAGTFVVAPHDEQPSPAGEVARK